MGVAKKGAPKKSGAPPAKKGVASTGLVQEDLKNSAGLWKDTPAPPPGSFGTIPDGKYHAVVEDAIIENGGKQRDRLQVKWSYRISGPTNANRMMWSNTGLADQQGVEFTKRYLAVLELPLPDEIEQLPDILAQAKGKRVELQVVTKPAKDGSGKEYQNTYMNKMLSEGDSAGPASTSSAVAEQIVSFLGKTVSFDCEGTEVQGTVFRHNGENIGVKDSEGTEYEMTMSDVSIVDASEAAAEEPAPKQPALPDLTGKTVSFKDDKNAAVQGKVVSSADAEGNIGVQVGDEEWSVPQAECTIVEAKGPIKKGPVKKTK